MTSAKVPYRLRAPVVPEHPIQKQIADTLRIELAPAGKVSKAGVVWFSVDHANYAGEVPGVRLGRGLVSGLADIFVVWAGCAHFIEIKTEDGQLSDAQRAVSAAFLMAGGRFGVVRNATEALALLDAWRIPRARRVKVAA